MAGPGSHIERIRRSARKQLLHREHMRIRQITDVDVAQESTNFAKYQILVQAGTSMLAQANQSPQSVLKLLQ